MTEYKGLMKGHRDWVTSLVCPQTTDSAIQVVSGSRDGTLVSWTANESRNSVEEAYCKPVRRLEGHTGFVQDVALTNNAEYALSASWDKSLRLWNLKTGACFGKFLGHTKDVLSTAFSPDNRHILSGGRDNKLKIWNVKGECVYTLDKDCHTKDVLSTAFSPDNRHILSGGRDNKLKIWNVKGECVYTLDKDCHTDWVSCVRFSPAVQSPLIVSGGWDNVVKVWSLSDFKCMHTLTGHSGYVSTVTVSPDGSLCASAGKDGSAKLWDLSRGENLYELTCGEPINQLAFSPNRYWLCAATASGVRIWDLESKDTVVEVVPETDKKTKPECLSVAWSADGSTLYCGYNDNTIRVFGVRD